MQQRMVLSGKQRFKPYLNISSTTILLSFNAPPARSLVCRIPPMLTRYLYYEIIVQQPCLSNRYP